jgi:hypothetical protein
MLYYGGFTSLFSEREESLLNAFFASIIKAFFVSSLDVREAKYAIFVMCQSGEANEVIYVAKSFSRSIGVLPGIDVFVSVGDFEYTASW